MARSKSRSLAVPSHRLEAARDHLCCLAWQIRALHAVPARFGGALHALPARFGGEGLYVLVAVIGGEAAAALLPGSYVHQIAAAVAGARSDCL